MLRNALAFSLLLAVTGCGGGGSDSSSTPSTGTGGNSGNGSDPLAQFINVQSQYAGLKTAAVNDFVLMVAAPRLPQIRQTRK